MFGNKAKRAKEVDDGAKVNLRSQSVVVADPPFDPRSVKHFVISGHDAVKCFEWIDKWQNDRSRAAQCRLWLWIAERFPETRGGQWALTMMPTEIVVHEPPNKLG